ncbi:tetraacyldisaccharide 4'-kinase [Christiangramia sp. SM2212]|uniref:Tetraacyldisaccharide 4'-kinase n=1 Tax=Christiangramia sediminicola TaxID=3073267 RepID=A0ABU1ERP8_9FLAO|nr:tetraacyldisaccharide 4'-kinase [Christiangramia sp. SM2212]MDR5591070.1 tetraacyldisaccharide 4'-kinase [Christiangramia sp. SM2212]
MPNFRKLLYPFSVLYHAVTGMRNILYDQQILNSESYDLPVICVGNLNTGGTGKSPMVEYLISLLNKKYKVATLSRGYKRESKGFRLVETDDSAAMTGDEPLQFKNKFPESFIAVNANRREGIAELLKFSPDVILLDDAFQHRKVKAGFYILLTAFGDLYINDLLLPGGNLRESHIGAERADVIVVTKCPEDISVAEMNRITSELKPLPGQDVFFSSIGYSNILYSDIGNIPLGELNSEEFTLITGIARPQPLVEYLQNKNLQFDHQKFPDHHNFNDSEIRELNKLQKIVTTEKDFMRLKGRIDSDRLFYLPIRTKFVNNRSEFNSKILEFVNKK